MKRSALLAALGLLVLSAGCGRTPRVSVADLEPVAHPELTTIENVARTQLEEARRRLTEARQESASQRELADAYGTLGELYHAYDLLPAATACYRNAERLDGDSFLWPYYLGALHQRAGDLVAAGDAFRRALARRPEDGPSRLRLAEVALARGELDEAEALFRDLATEPELAAAASFGLGRARLARGEPRQALEPLEHALELQPAAGLVHHSLGLAHRQLGDAEQAARHLGEKGSGEPTYPDRLMERITSLAVTAGAFLKRGNRELVNGRFEAAVDFFRQAMEADPSHGDARRNLAHALTQQGDFEAALQVLKEAAEQVPESVWIHFDLGNAYLQNGLAEPALEAFRRAIELAPDFAEGHFNLANGLGRLGRWQEAQPHLARAVELEPQDRRARYLAAMAQHHLGENPPAIRDLRALLRQQPTDTTVREGLATVLTANRQRAQAERVYRDGLELELPAEERNRLLFALAELSWRSGRRQEAITAWRRAVELDPESSQTHTALANGLQLLNQRQEARQEFARAIELDPSNTTAWLSEASLWILDREFQQAKSRLTAALGQHPEHAGLHHTLARLLATAPDPAVRDGRQALLLAQKTYGLEKNLEHAETVGMALAEIGRFEEAIAWQRGLIHQAAVANDRTVMRRLVKRLKLYEQRQAVRIGN